MVALLREEALDGPIAPVGVPDDDVEATLDDAVQLGANDAVQMSNAT
jgi:hypothetical protein